MSASNSNGSFLDRHYLLIRRLHSLSGVLPIGVFLFPHLTTNASIVWGKMLNKPHYEVADTTNAGVETFQHEVNFIHDLPALILIEWGVLFLPIMFHAGVGIWFATSGRTNVDRYKYQANWRYTLQRLSGYIGVLFIFMHITSLRFGWNYGGIMVPFVSEAASSSTARHFQESPLGVLVPLFYLVSVLGLVFHFANGLWTAAITWGLTVSTTAQQRWGYVCAAVGVGLGLAAVTAIWGFTTLDVEQAQAIESLMQAAHGAAEPAAVTAATP